MTEEYSIEDLENHSGIPTRTLHYYMQLGLLPGPDKRGKYASYSQEHIDRLDLILILKEMHLPLAEIGNVLNQLTPYEISHYRDDQEDLLNKIRSVKPEMEEKEASNKQSSALEYIKGLEQAHTTRTDITDNRPQLYQNSSPINFSEPNESLFNKGKTKPDSQIWRRIILQDGIELNVRDTQDKEVRYKIERLLSFARSIFEK